VVENREGGLVIQGFEYLDIRWARRFTPGRALLQQSQLDKRWQGRQSCGMANSDHPGLSSLWIILLALVLGVFLATVLPVVVLTKDVVLADWLGFSGGIIGAACTIFAGWLAYSAVQVQIRDYREAARQTTFATLDAQFRNLGRDIDLLRLAHGFLNSFANNFPATTPGAEGGFTDSLRDARWRALDFVSNSATRAPFGYGESISTVMIRIQRIGDRIEDQAARGIQPPAINKFYDPIIMQAVSGLRSIADQIEGDIPIHTETLVRLANERDRFA
jgi:hypothetical protein